jgi:hypothetical protein
MAKPLFEAQVSPLAGRLRPHAVSAATRLPVVILINSSGKPKRGHRTAMSERSDFALERKTSPDPACKTLGVSARPHDLRATCASLLIDGRRRCSTAPIHALEDCSRRPLRSPLGSACTTGPEVLLTTELKGGKVNRGIIGVIIGVLVIIILVIVILQLT